MEGPFIPPTTICMPSSEPHGPSHFFNLTQWSSKWRVETIVNHFSSKLHKYEVSFAFHPQIIQTANFTVLGGRGRIGDFYESKHLLKISCPTILEHKHRSVIFGCRNQWAFLQANMPLHVSENFSRGSPQMCSIRHVLLESILTWIPCVGNSWNRVMACHLGFRNFVFFWKILQKLTKMKFPFWPQETHKPLDTQ